MTSTPSAQKVLITTPDYYPKLGGLSRFTQNIEHVLTKLKIPYDLHVWNRYQDLIASPISTNAYKAMINIHFLGGMSTQGAQIPVLNFFHGSEILFYSPNFFKHMIKKIQKNRMLRKIEADDLNIFISEYTLEKIKSLGFRQNVASDLIVHNGIDCHGARFVSRELNAGPFTLICVARDVPHKNLDGAVSLAKNLYRAIQRPIKLMLTTTRTWPVSEGVELVSLGTPSHDSLKKFVSEAHYNLLLSLDHSKLGFFEGFGLSALEAGMFGTPTLAFPTGGLPENIHHGINGHLIQSNHIHDVEAWFQQLTEINYRALRVSTFEHTIANHSLEIYEKILTNWQAIRL